MRTTIPPLQHARAAIRTSDHLALRAAIPDYPEAVPATPERWAALQRVIRATQPPISELSAWSNAIWLGGTASVLSRIDDLVLVQFADDDRQRMLVALPHASLPTDGPELTILAHLLRRAPVRYLTGPTAGALAPAARAIGAELGDDRDEADYVYGVAQLAQLAGPALAGKRRDAARLERRHRARTHVGTLGERRTRTHLVESYERWLAAKYDDRPMPDAVAHERASLLELLEEPRARRLWASCLTVDDRPAGFSLLEPMWDRTWMGLIFKTDPALPGATAYLRRAVGRLLLDELGAAGRLNVQQDVGEPGLRRAKQSFQPLFLHAKRELRSRPTQPEAPRC